MERLEERLGGGAIVGGYPELLRTVYASVLAASDEAVEAPAAPASLQQCVKLKKMSAPPDATAGGGWSTAEAEEQRADGWMAAH